MRPLRPITRTAIIATIAGTGWLAIYFALAFIMDGQAVPAPRVQGVAERSRPVDDYLERYHRAMEVRHEQQQSSTR